MHAPEASKKTLIHQPTLFSFESYRDYRHLEGAIRDHICPQNILEEIWVAEIVEAQWEIQRLRRYKSQIVNSLKLSGLQSLLNSISDGDDAENADLARRFFTNKAIKKQVNAMLRNFDLDESAVEVEAYRLSMQVLKQIDCRLMELAKRRDKLFQQIEDYRAGISAPAGSGAPQRFGQEITIQKGGDTDGERTADRG
jgi:hypothetical protein